MNMKLQLVRGMLALAMFASVGGWAMTHRVAAAKPVTSRMAMLESQHADKAAILANQDVMSVEIHAAEIARSHANTHHRVSVAVSSTTATP